MYSLQKRLSFVFSALKNNDISQVNKIGYKYNNNRLLALYELDNFYHLNSDFEKSIHLFNLANNLLCGYENQALISITNTVKSGMGIIGSEKILPYRGLLYEKNILHNLNAINYLFINDLEGALVELRKISKYQQIYDDDKKKTK